MGPGLLVTEQIEAGEELIREFDRYAPVSVAFWAKPTDADDLYLYIASDHIDDTNFDVAYGEIVRIFANNRAQPAYQWLDQFRIKLLYGSSRPAQEAIKIRDRFSAPIPTRFGGTSLGGLSIDGAYIYPPLASMNQSAQAKGP